MFLHWSAVPTPPQCEGDIRFWRNHQLSQDRSVVGIIAMQEGSYLDCALSQLQ